MNTSSRMKPRSTLRGIAQLSMLCPLGGRNPLHDGFDMRSGSIQMGKISILRIEYEREVSSGKKNRIQTFSINQRVSEGTQVLVIRLGGVLLLDNAHIDVAQQIELCRTWRDNVRVRQSPEQFRFDSDACTKDRNPLQLASLDFGGDGIEKADQRQWRHFRQLLRAYLRRKRRNGRDLRTSTGQLA